MNRDYPPGIMIEISDQVRLVLLSMRKGGDPQGSAKLSEEYKRLRQAEERVKVTSMMVETRQVVG
jgi:plasmid replication initiation protein